MLKEVESAVSAGIIAIALFPIVPAGKKDMLGSEAFNEKNILFKAVREIKKAFPEICVITDVALDPYTSHAHDGLVDGSGDVENDKTVEALARAALLQAEAGVDMVAPSDMMDGRVLAIRRALDTNGFQHVAIQSYTAKYVSSLYAPFRDAVSSRLRWGHKRTYQMNPANQREALIEAALDEQEGADVIMVKPAGFYLDVIAKIRENTELPVSAFQVSGEYAMIQAASKNGWLDETDALYESLLSIKRAGADMIFTYGASKIASLLTSGALD